MTTSSPKRKTNSTNGNGRAIGGVASMNGYVKSIADIMRRSGRAGALQYVPEMTWMIFLRILDEREQLQDSEFGAVMRFVNDDLFPTIRRFEQSAMHGSRQHVLSQIFSNTTRAHIDTEYNLLEILDKIHLLFEDAPSQFNVVLSNPPFGGKESKAAQAKFTYKTNATQVLFLQHIFDSLKDGGVCGIVMDEGVLFRTNEGGFVGAKKKLCDDFEVYCIVSLPGGVFTDAGAGVKTNLVFFRKGRPTKRIWYYDLSSLKINKSSPLKLSHFDDFLTRYALDPDDPQRASSCSWTLDFEARQQVARDAAAPLQARAKAYLAEADQLQKAIGKLKPQLRQAATRDEWDALQTKSDRHSAEQRANVKQARELENEAQGILDAVYDLKAVNPHAADTGDQRTPNELLSVIEEAQREISAGISALRTRRHGA